MQEVFDIQASRLGIYLVKHKSGSKVVIPERNGLPENIDIGSFGRGVAWSMIGRLWVRFPSLPRLLATLS
jgi:hypothetical protein